jgi:hypothetical protein
MINPNRRNSIIRVIMELKIHVRDRITTGRRETSEKESTCILPFVHPNEHVITCSSFMGGIYIVFVRTYAPGNCIS